MDIELREIVAGWAGWERCIERTAEQDPTEPFGWYDASGAWRRDLPHFEKDDLEALHLFRKLSDEYGASLWFDHRYGWLCGDRDDTDVGFDAKGDQIQGHRLTGQAVMAFMESVLAREAEDEE